MNAIQPDKIPTALKERPQFVLYRNEMRDDKPTKVPYQVNGRKARSNHKNTWATFDTVEAAFERGGFDGYGFMFSADDDLMGIDLDGCRNPETGEIDEWAKEIIKRLDSYAEVSPSQTGVKLFMLGMWPIATGKKKILADVPKWGNKAPAIEGYDRLRYFTTTGWRLSGPHEPQARQEIIDAIARQFWPTAFAAKPAAKVVPAPSTDGHDPTDEQIIAKAQGSKNGEKFCRLWSGDTSDYGGDHSAADLALVSMLSFWTGPDKRHIDALFRQSGLVREKWTEREDYRSETIAKALGGHREFYKWNGRTKERKPPNDESEMSVRDGKPAELSLDSSEAPQRGGGQRKPRIQSTDENLAMHTAAAWNAIALANKPPLLFRFGGRPARITRGDDGEPAIGLLDLHSARSIVADVAVWYKFKRVGEDTREVSAYPPDKAVHSVLATPEPPLPILARVVEAPVFSHDGTLQTEPGYHPASRTYFAPAEGFVVPDVPQWPTPNDIAKAVGLITVELLGDFPFTGPSELAHGVALLLQPFARDMIEGATPMHLFEKPSPGTGATLLTDTLGYPATGRRLAAMTEGKSEDEWRKRITATLKDGPAYLQIDNVRSRLDSSALSAAITANVWEDRILGVSQNIRIAVRCAWLATGNNPAMSNEMTRRTVRIRLDAKCDEPWLRKGWRHPDLRTWAKTNRGSLVWAALVLIQAWIAEGRPEFTGQKLGMFESWSATIGGILAVAGIPGFLTNCDEFYSASDDETAGWREFIANWWVRFGDREITSKELWGMIGEGEDTEEAPCDLGQGNPRSRQTRFGKALSKMRDRVFTCEVKSRDEYNRPQGGETRRLRLDRLGAKHSVATWRLTPTG